MSEPRQIGYPPKYDDDACMLETKEKELRNSRDLIISVYTILLPRIFIVLVHIYDLYQQALSYSFSFSSHFCFSIHLSLPFNDLSLCLSSMADHSGRWEFQFH